MNKEMAASVALRAAALLEMGPTKGALARDADGDQCPPQSGKAQSFCAVGAIERANREIGNGSSLNDVRRLFNARCAEKFNTTPMNINDHFKHGPTILVAALRAIARELDREISNV